MQLNYTKEAPQGIVIEIVGNKDILFEKEYEKAQIAIEDIVSQQLKSNGNSCYEDRPLINNRIIFTGQRGSGKTSALLSLKNHLKIYGIDIPNKKKNGNSNISFYCLPTIDPSYFDGKNNILTTVLSSMFSDAKKVMEKYDKQGERRRNEYEDLLKNFAKVYKALGQIMPSGNNQSFTIEKLNDVSNASDINSLMDRLLKSFKRFLKDDNDKLYKFLLVIDDLDMNVACAADMMEQVRKFLSLDDMVILMSANIDQLHYEMCEHYSKAFVNTMNDKDQARFIEVEDMASRYLLKLFPTSRRINVEHPISQLLNADLAFPELDENGDVVRIDENGKVAKDGKGDVKYKKKGNLQSTILSLIWGKTRLLFVPGKNELHPIIPTNLRELVQFIDVVEGMDDVQHKKGKLFSSIKEYEKCKNNISKFKEYFIKTWVPTNLSIEEENVFYSVPEKVDEVNKYLINAINVIGSNNKRRLMSREVDLDIIEKNAEGVTIDRDIYTMVSPNDPRFVKANKISDIFNQPSNYSYGDLLLMLDKYETYFESERDRRFSNAIKIYYSILLFETMFYRSNCINYNAPKGETDDEIAINLKDRVNDIIPIQRLIGGTIYYPNYFEIITSKYFKQKGPSYDAKRAFYHKVKEDETDDMPLFSVLYYGDIRPDRYDTKHVYDTTFEHDSEVDGERYKTFDILSIINNILNPWQTIGRAMGSEPHIGKWKEKIDEWGTFYCHDNKEKPLYPNTILPFYSVDMMLRYIRKSYDIQEICNDIKNDYFKKEEIVSNWLGLIDYDNGRISFDKLKEYMQNDHKISIEECNDGQGSKDGEKKTKNKCYTINYDGLKFSDLLSKANLLRDGNIINDNIINKINSSLIKKLKNEKILKENAGEYTLNTTTDLNPIPIIQILENEKIIKFKDNNKTNDGDEELQGKEYIFDLDNIDTTNEAVRSFINKLISIRVIRNGNNLEIYNDSDKKLANGFKIVAESQKNMKSLAEKETLVNKDGLECFRDFVIAKIMSLYSGGQREQDMLIKNLYHHNSITEMYRYLVDTLWKDAIIEYCIRQEIQKNVHSRKCIGNYYDKLFEITMEGFIDAFGKNETTDKKVNNKSSQKNNNNEKETDLNKVCEKIKHLSTYHEIYNEAKKIFILDETAQKS